MASAIPKTSPKAQADELTELKQLLFGEETESLDDLRQRIVDPKQRAADTAAVLSESVKVAAQTDNKLAEALSGSVSGCIRSIIQKDPQDFADALFPVMGPAIRKSISETLKTFVESMNQVIEQSMSPQAFGWRIESWRTGIPFPDIIFKNTVVYRVDEVFLIQQGTGMLIAHLSHPDVAVRDSDAISAMLTVIRDFVRDSFSSDATQTLSKVEIGEQTLWIFEGPKALLACLIRGVLPPAAHDDFQSVLEQIHSQYPSELENFDGDRSELEQLDGPLEQCLKQQTKSPVTRKPDEKGSIFSKPVTYVILLLALAAIYFLWHNIAESRRIDSLRADLEETAGIVVLDIDERNGQWVVDGMVDPLAKPPQTIAEKHGFSADDMRFDMSLYQSLEPPMAVERARKFLEAPDSIILTAQGETLRVSGTASRIWIEGARKSKTSLLGFQGIDLSQVKIDNDAEIERIRKILNAPASVVLEIENRILHVSGTAPYGWINQIRDKTPKLSRIDALVLGQRNILMAQEWVEAEAIVTEIDGAQLYFSDDTALRLDSVEELNRVTLKLSRLIELTKILGSYVNIVLIGYTDGTGDFDSNQQLRMERAESIRARLLARGIAPSSVILQAANDTSPEKDLSLRRVDFNIEIAKPGHEDSRKMQERN